MARRAGIRLNSFPHMESAITTNEPAEAKRQLVENLCAAVARCGSQGTHVALILIELSRRGAFGDNGNPAGMETTFRELLRAVQAHCGRNHDFVLRISNDGIAAVCPDTHAAGASHIAARIREASVFLPSRRGLPLPLAIGVAVSGPESGENAADILSRAKNTLESARTRTAPLLSVNGARPKPRKTASFVAQFVDLFRKHRAPADRRRAA
jgi:GGDEF domain-containing protein